MNRIRRTVTVGIMSAAIMVLPAATAFARGGSWS